MFDNKGLCTKEITCPYCGYAMEDSYEFDDYDEHTCDNCDKVYTSDRNEVVTYTSTANCTKNGLEHDFTKSSQNPRTKANKWIKCDNCDNLEVRPNYVEKE